MSSVPRALRPVLGDTTGSAAVALLALVSFITYLCYSRAVQLMMSGWSYLQFVLSSAFKTPNVRTFAFEFSPSAMAVLTFVVFVLSCVAVGWLASRASHTRRAAAPMGWVFALTASVVPTIIIAIVRWPDGGGSIDNTTICVAQLVLVALVWFWARRTIANRGDLPEETATVAAESLPLWLRLLTVLAALYALTVLVSGFSGIFGYDSYSDHLSRPARWLATQTLERGTSDEVVTFYPGNFELLVRWTFSLGTDRFAFLSFASGISAVWVVYRIGLEIGQTRTAAVMSALGAASLQVLAYQGTVVYSDSYTALCLLLATWLLIVWVRDGADSAKLTLAFGLAIGLSLGAKYSAGPAAVMLCLVWIWNSWKTSGWSDGMGDAGLDWRAFIRSMVVLTIGVLPAMAYWYVLNTVEQHNPLYPLSIMGLPGLNIGALLANVPGPTAFADRLTYAWTEVKHGPGFETGLGPMFASVAIIGIFAAPFSLPHAKSGQRLAWLILILVFVAWWRSGVLVPRYGLFPLLLSFVFVGELWRAFSSRLLAAVFATAAFATMVTVGHEMLAGAAYNELMFDPNPRVPAAINELPASRILNVAGQPSGYYAMGRDHRHKVISLFKQATPEDVRKLAPDYVLLPQARESEFVPVLGLELISRWEKSGQESTSLWRVTGASASRAP